MIKKENPDAKNLKRYFHQTDEDDGDEGQSAKEDSDKKFRLRRMKHWRLIVRNLSFSCKAEDVRKEFSRFGEIEELILPPAKKDPSRIAGFAFVQYRKESQAMDAMKSMNEKEICGRPVAVDWAVPKDQYMTAVIEEKQQEKNENQNKINIKSEPIDEDEIGKKDDHENQAGPSESSDEEETKEESIDFKKKNQKPVKKEVDIKEKPEKTSDVEEGRTVFIRNIPFDVDDDRLGKHLSEFGAIKYALICKYPDTNHSKGSGFAQFLEKSSADKCLEKAGENGEGVFVQGQRLIACLAVSKEKAQKLNSEKHDKKQTDKRNLHLLRVGMIRAGTTAAEGVSGGDLAIRMRIEAANRVKIKNLHIFVSPTRLCVHNLPGHVDDRNLKKVCYEMVNDSNAKITECRIMRDLDRPNSKGVGKSRGYAFVEFTEHQHALSCLNRLNNNPDVFTPDKRPIVEFSLENMRALQVKQQRLEKARMRQQEKANQPPLKNNRKSGRKFKKLLVPAGDGSSGAKQKTDVDAKSKGKTKTKQPKPFPSHFGPKIRHKPRAKPAKDKRADKNNTSKNKGEVKKKKHKKRREEKQQQGDNEAAAPSAKKRRWFEN